MSSSGKVPSIMVSGGSDANPAGLSDPGDLEVAYQNLLSGAADILSGTGTKTFILTAGAIASASTLTIGNEETAGEVANNASILAQIAAFCKANGINVEVDAVLTDNNTYGTGPDAINAPVDMWAKLAATAGLPITAVEDVQEIGTAQSPDTFASYATIEANAVRTLLIDYASSSYKMSVSNLAVGDMEGAPASMAALPAWWNAYDTAARAEGVPTISYTTADTGWFAPWIGSVQTWQGYLEVLSTLAAANRLSLDILVQGAEVDTSSDQFVQQAEQNAADLATLQATGSLVFNSIMIQSWNALPVGVGMITSPTSSSNEAAEIGAIYPLYESGSISAQGSLSFSSPGQIILQVGTAKPIVPISVQWDATDLMAGNRLGVVIIDQTGALTATQHGSGIVSSPADNILILNGDAADLAAELLSVRLTESNAGPDTIDVETYGATGRESDNQISVLAAAPHQVVGSITSASNAQGWLSSSAILNNGTAITDGSVMTSETLQWSTTGTLSGTITGAAMAGQSAFTKIVSIHEPLAEYGVENVSSIVFGTPTNEVLDINDQTIDNGAFPAGGYANNPGVNNVTFAPLPGWLPGSFNPDTAMTPLIVQSTTNTFDPVSGQLDSSVDILMPDPLTVVDSTGTHPDQFATAFNNGGSQVTEFNTGNNPMWQAGWGSQFSSVTSTYDSTGQLVERFLQGGSSNPSFTVDDVFDPNTGQLWEAFQSTDPPPVAQGTTNYATTNNAYQPGFVSGALYVTEFNTGDNPNWDLVDWGSQIASDTEVWADYMIEENFPGLTVNFPGQYAGAVNAYPYEFVNGSTLDLISLPGTANVNLNALGTVTIDSQTMVSGLNGLTAIDAAGATGSICITGLSVGGSTLIGGGNVSTITGYGHDTIVTGAGLTAVNTGNGSSSVTVSSAQGSVTLAGNNDVVNAIAGSTLRITGEGETVDGSNMTVVVGSNSSVTVNGENDTISLIGSDINLSSQGKNLVSTTDSAADVATNINTLERLAKAGALVSIHFNDEGTPVFTITDEEITADADALALIRSPYILDPTAAEATAAAALPGVAAVAVNDTSANVVANLDALQRLAASGKLVSITFTDSGDPNLSLSAGQLSADSAALARIDGPYTVETQAVTGTPTTIPTPGLGVQDTTTGQVGPAIAQSYTGPVEGLREQFIDITTDSLNITATTPGWFIHSGSGEDALAVQSGTNVLDGGTGSNFLVGGSGLDTFFADARGATSDIWDTIVNFHAGDAVTLWGVTRGDYNFTFVDGQGAAGYAGLTLHATAPGEPTVSVTFAGLTMGSLNSGALSETSGMDPTSGSTYTYFHELREPEAQYIPQRSRKSIKRVVISSQMCLTPKIIMGALVKMPDFVIANIVDDLIEELDVRAADPDLEPEPEVGRV